MNEAHDRFLQLFKEGRLLSPDALQQLEVDLAREPNNLDARATVLGGYSADLEPRLPDFLRHQRWIIENVPGDVLAESAVTCTVGLRKLYPSAYRELHDAWCERVRSEPVTLSTLVHAWMFFMLHEEFEMAEHAARQSMARAPDDSAPIEMLVDVVDSSNTATSERCEELFLLADGVLERDTDLLKMLGLSVRLADFALRTKNWSHASEFAKRVLHRPGACDKAGSAIHAAHVVLGRLALKDGDQASACKHLLESLEIPGDTFFEPDLELATELLMKGELETVEEYLGLCMQFPLSDYERSQLRTWCLQMGVLPPFS
ncbi:MAG: hypothetical protein KC777_18865 [Cyanobacteria bacterium HKST-UBA02]|nr:hypothetical protein [Cyanobacteria bacterium HKST-UBA02]